MTEEVSQHITLLAYLNADRFTLSSTTPGPANSYRRPGGAWLSDLLQLCFNKTISSVTLNLCGNWNDIGFETESVFHVKSVYFYSSKS